MIIKIHRRDDPYARIDNRALSDKRLSYRARGILAYLLSKPNNWTVRPQEVLNNGTEGRDAVRKAFKELRTHGYALLSNSREGRVWTIYEAPEAKDGFSGDGPCPEKANDWKSVSIVTKEKSTNERPMVVADSDFAKRIRAIMHRREATGFSAKELASFKKILSSITDDDLCMLERYYAKNWPPNSNHNILRHDLYTFLNNYHGEVDRALQWCEKHPLRSTRTVRSPATEFQAVAIPDDPEAQRAFLASFESHFHRLPHGYYRVNGEVVFTGQNGAPK